MQPHLEKWRENNFELVFVSSDRPETLKKFFNQHKLTGKVLLDQKFTAGKLYQVSGIPVDYLVNEKGVIEHSFVGWGGQKSLAGIESWVTKKP